MIDGRYSEVDAEYVVDVLAITDEFRNTLGVDAHELMTRMQAKLTDAHKRFMDRCDAVA